MYGSLFGDLKYQLRDKEPIDLAQAQEKATKIDRNMQSCGRSNLPGFTRGNPSSSNPNKSKSNEILESSNNPLKELTDVIKAMEANHAAQINAMQNRLIAMERNQSHSPNQSHPHNHNQTQNHRYPQNNQKWQRRGAPQDQRPPNQLETTNMVHDEVPSFCRVLYQNLSGYN